MVEAAMQSAHLRLDVANQLFGSDYWFNVLLKDTSNQGSKPGTFPYTRLALYLLCHPPNVNVITFFNVHGL